VREEKRTQPTGCWILCQTYEERTECRIEEARKWADHDQYFKTNEEVQHDRATQVRFALAHRFLCVMFGQSNWKISEEAHPYFSLSCLEPVPESTGFEQWDSICDKDHTAFCSDNGNDNANVMQDEN
jgi:hypothetical protein